MPKYLAKLSKFGGQCRLTLPRLLVEEMAWDDVEYITLGPQIDKSIIIRRFVDAESLGIKREKDRPGSD
ncbi:hypothetical protein ES702_05942 [subsurface metagenome]